MLETIRTSYSVYPRERFVVDLAQARRQQNAEVVDEILRRLESGETSQDRVIDAVVDRLLDKVG